MIIETERLYLRELTPDDFDVLYSILSDPETMQHYPAPYNAEQVHGWIERNRRRYAVLGFGLWAVCLKSSGKMIGECGLTMQNINGFIAPEIGYHIHKAHQRQGYAAEAAGAVRDWAFANTPFRELYSYMKYTNLPSQKTALSYGCRYITEYKDEPNGITKVYGLKKEDCIK